MTDSTLVEWIEEYKETMISGGQQQTGRLNYDMYFCYRNLVYRGALNYMARCVRYYSNKFLYSTFTAALILQRGSH